MATKTWTGDTNKNWNEADNWEPSGVPASADSVYITSTSDDIVGYDGSAVALTDLVVGQQFTGKIGTSGTKMQIDATNLDYSGVGESAYFEGTYATLTVQNTSTSTTALNLSGSSDTITTLRILGGRGTINIASSCNIVTTIEQIGADGVTTNIADSTTIGGSCSLTMDSGKFELNQAVPTITVFGGDLEATLDTGTVTTLDMYGGRVRWNPTEACTITTLTVYDGLFDSRDSTSATFTVTNTTLFNGSINERSGLNNATWTNPINYEGDGEFLYDIGREITVT